MAWIALTEKHLTTGGRAGIHTSEGSAAVISGFFWLAAAIGFIGVGASFNRFKRLIRLALAIIWMSIVTWYLIFVGV